MNSGFMNKFNSLRRGRRRRPMMRGRFRGNKRMVKGIMRNIAEKKFAFKQGIITGNLGNDLGGVPTFITPNFPIGAGKTERIGSNIQYKFLTLRANLNIYWDGTTISGAGIEGTYFVRVILFQARVPIATTAQVINIVNVEDATMLTALPMVAPPLNQNVRILNDDTFPLFCAQNANNSNGYSINTGTVGGCTFTWRHKINNAVNFRSTSELLPSDPKDQYGIVFLVKGNNDAVALDGQKVRAKMNYGIKISYTDI